MNVRVFAVLLIVVIAAAVGVVIGVAASGNSGPTNVPLPSNIVTVTGGATVSSAPDEATVKIGVRSDAPTALEAQQTNAKKVSDVMKALQQAGVAKADIQTTDMSLNKHYQNRGQKNETVTYQADNEFEVKVHDLTKVGDVTDQAVAAGANVVGGIQFTLSDVGAAKAKALQQAIASAHQKAQTLATAAGATLGSVVRIDEENTQVRPYYAHGQALDVFAAAPVAMPTTPVSPQQVQTEVSVKVVYQLNG